MVSIRRSTVLILPFQLELLAQTLLLICSERHESNKKRFITLAPGWSVAPSPRPSRQPEPVPEFPARRRGRSSRREAPGGQCYKTFFHRRRDQICYNSCLMASLVLILAKKAMGLYNKTFFGRNLQIFVIS